MLTTDPRIVAAARPVPLLTFDEATELAFFGATVLHPSAMQPALQTEGLDVRVKNSYNRCCRRTCLPRTGQRTVPAAPCIACGNQQLCRLTPDVSSGRCACADAAPGPQERGGDADQPRARHGGRADDQHRAQARRHADGHCVHAHAGPVRLHVQARGLPASECPFRIASPLARHCRWTACAPGAGTHGKHTRSQLAQRPVFAESACGVGLMLSARMGGRLRRMQQGWLPVRRVFNVFLENQVSVDVVATSEISVSLTLDPGCAAWSSRCVMSTFMPACRSTRFVCVIECRHGGALPRHHLMPACRISM